MTIPRYKHFFKRLDKFSVCAIKADPNWIGVERDVECLGAYHYVVHGRAKVGVPFKEEYFEVKSKDFFSMQHLFPTVMMDIQDDFYMIGFSALHGKEKWDGRLVTEPTVLVQKESHLICFDGNPIVNGKQLERFDYADLSPDRTYEINLNGGALGLFTECSV